ncbi:YqaE/Pmp3 family membrane protein [Novosphingopyxis sp.]|uniref:YqaE/Pmp3 family membrane protein n=1 Tax=Novosphingopyxis sp. TaxID=2709690 RepID=UPI003B5B6511
MPILQIILAVILPPLAVFLKRGVGPELLISIVLCIVFWVPGILYALYIVLSDRGTAL